jgi:hypothetical protein
LQLQSILKEGLRSQQSKGLTKVGSKKYFLREDDREINELIIEKLTSDYTFENLVCSEDIHEELKYFVKEHQGIDILKQFDLPVVVAKHWHHMFWLGSLIK